MKDQCNGKLTWRPPWLSASTAELLGSVLRVPVTPLLDSRPWSTYTSPHTKQYSTCTSTQGFA